MLGGHWHLKMPFCLPQPVGSCFWLGPFLACRSSTLEMIIWARSIFPVARPSPFFSTVRVGASGNEKDQESVGDRPFLTRFIIVFGQEIAGPVQLDHAH